MTTLALRLPPATHAEEHEPHVIARGGWVMTGLALELCVAALGRPQTLALCDGTAPTATLEDIGRIRQVFEAAAAGPADLGGAAANNWLTLLNAALGLAGGRIVEVT